MSLLAGDVGRRVVGACWLENKSWGCKPSLFAVGGVCMVPSDGGPYLVARQVIVFSFVSLVF